MFYRLTDWYLENARPLPWRAAGTTAWGVLVSEIMSQQTPVARVAPRWEEWLERWPTPADFAAAPTAEVLKAWANLGYPRRALRLKEAAQAIVSDHGGEVPSQVADLLALPGIGDYTARAVACFHFKQNVPVVDTNVRRVVARAVHGQAIAGPARKQDLADVAALLPDDGTGPVFSVALMELGALVCTANNPQCTICPIQQECAWAKAGFPPAPEELLKKKRTQKFTGTDRQVRGKIMGHLRAHDRASLAELTELWPDKAQFSRALYSLVEDQLIELIEAAENNEKPQQQNQPTDKPAHSQATSPATGPADSQAVSIANNPDNWSPAHTFFQLPQG